MERPYNESVLTHDLKYYIFDWDDNILHMPTYIHLERKLADGRWVPHLVSTALFSVIRKDTENYRPPNQDWESAFVEFRDFANDEESKFLTDAKAALERVESGLEKVPPSFNTFRKSLIEGRIFAIVTARGHQPETLRKGVELFIDKVLTPAEREEMILNLRGYTVRFDGAEVNDKRTDEEVLDNYLSLNRYHAVTNPDFIKLVQNAEIPDAQKSEVRKKYAIVDFIDHLFGIIERVGADKPISVGFSDDDPINVSSLLEFVRDNLAKRFPSVKFVVYDTSDPTLEKGRKMIVSGQLDLPLGF
jgi:hypothetical protein